MVVYWGLLNDPHFPSGLELGEVKRSAVHGSVEERALNVQQPGLPDSEPQGGMGVPVWQSYTRDARAGESKDGRSAGWGPGEEELTAGQHVLGGQCVSSRPREVTGGLGVISQWSENASSTTWGHSPLLSSNTKGWAEGAPGEGAQVGAGGLGLRCRVGAIHSGRVLRRQGTFSAQRGRRSPGSRFLAVWCPGKVHNRAMGLPPHRKPADGARGDATLPVSLTCDAQDPCSQWVCSGRWGFWALVC